MVYKHRTQSGKVRHYQSKGHYENSLKGMFAKDYQKKDHSKKIQKMKHKNTKSVPKTRKVFISAKTAPKNLQTKLSKTFNQINKKYFDNSLDSISILIKTNYPHPKGWAGAYKSEWKDGKQIEKAIHIYEPDLHPILLENIIKHESIHYWQDVKKKGKVDHGKTFMEKLEEMNIGQKRFKVGDEVYAHDGKTNKFHKGKFVGKTPYLIEVDLANKLRGFIDWDFVPDMVFTKEEYQKHKKKG
ncbi:MAG: SprT-like domain-containing protein [Promethearchaeota archaeon]|jgi:hypothetical protein